MNNETIALIIATIAVVALIDYVPRAFVAARRAVKVTPGRGRTPRYLIMPTVYGDISYLQNIPFLKKYADKVVICTSTHEKPEFYTALRKVCRQHGFRYIRAEVPIVKGQPVKNAYTIYKGAFKNLRRLKVSGDTPCILIDADTYALKNVNNLARTFIGAKLDIASLRCEAANPKTTIEILQDFEYKIAMDNRRMDPWLTSGACNIAKAKVYRHVFSRHSDFFAGGDIEIGKLAQVMGYKIRHIGFTFYTALPDTFKDWYKQRIIWFAGGIRHHVANIGGFGWHHFFMLLYNSLIIYLLLPLRWFEIINFPLTMALLIAISWLYTAILVWGRGWWRPAYLLLPFYSFLQSMIIIPVALVRYLKLTWKLRSFGLLKFDLSRNPFSVRLLYRTLNIGSASLVILAAFVFTDTRVQYWLQNGWLFN